MTETQMSKEALLEQIRLLTGAIEMKKKPSLASYSQKRALAVTHSKNLCLINKPTAAPSYTATKSYSAPVVSTNSYKAPQFIKTRNTLVRVGAEGASAVSYSKAPPVCPIPAERIAPQTAINHGGRVMRKPSYLKNWQHAPYPAKVSKPEEAKTFCQYFPWGECSRGLACPFIHDKKRLPICKSFLSGRCTVARCPFSHSPNEHNMPICLHFGKGRCSKDDCQYLHVKVGEDATICPEFAHQGFCDKGSTCSNRHAFQCPDFAKDGVCKKKGCRLLHQRARPGPRKDSAEAIDLNLFISNGEEGRNREVPVENFIRPNFGKIYIDYAESDEDER